VKLESGRLTPEIIDEYTRAGIWTDRAIIDVLESQATAFPERTALVDARGRMTYGEYFAAAQRIATRFVELGLSRDDVIAVQLPNWKEFALVVAGAMLAGIPFCQFHSDFRSKEVEFILGFMEASTIVCPQSFRGFDYGPMIDEMRPRLPRLRHVLMVGDDVPPEAIDLRALVSDPAAPVDAAALRSRRPRGNDLLRVAFTSGTTGDPKAVQHTSNTTMTACRICNRIQLLDAEGATLIFLPVGLNWGLFLIIEAILAGCKAVLLERFDAGEVLRLIETERISHFAAAPASIIALLDHPEIETRDVGSLRVYVTGGASCPVEVIERAERAISARLLEMYGMLETGTTAQTLVEDDPRRVVGLVGMPIPEVPMRILDDEGHAVPPGTVGEIANRGPSVMIGYYNNPAANERAFTPEGWFKTGDLGVIDADGYLKIVGRKKEMIIRAGANVYPREIEEVLFKHPAVADGAVIGVPHPRTGEQVVACVVLRPGTQLSFEDLVAFLAPQIAKYKLPERLEILPALPRTPTGKVQKDRLVERVAGEVAR